MPLYDYRCTQCGKLTEVRHGFNDTFAEPCAECGGALGRVFNAAPIVFKGSGFYVTDSRKPSAGESKPSTESTSPSNSSNASTSSNSPSSSSDSAA